MRPVDVQQIGEELAVKWEDGSESFVQLEKLRRHCPCAGCRGEVDVMGNVYKNPPRPLTAEAFRLVRLGRVGGYGVQPVWADGHATGIYSFEYLRRLAEASFWGGVGEVPGGSPAPRHLRIGRGDRGRSRRRVMGGRSVLQLAQSPEPFERFIHLVSDICVVEVENRARF